MALIDEDKENMPLLSQDLTDFLESKTWITPVKNKKRRLSPTLLSSPSPFHEVEKITEDTATITIPENITSRETFEYIGYNEKTSQDLWDTLRRMNSLGYEENVISISENHIKSRWMNASNSTDDWWAYLDKLGVDSTWAERIMNPEYEQERCSFSCAQLVLDGTLARYRWLCNLDRNLHEVTARIRAIEDDRAVGKGKSEVVETSPPRQEVDKKPSRGTAEKDDSKALAVGELSKGPLPDHMDHHTMLWRGGWKENELRFHNPSSSRVFSCDRIAARPGDFSAVKTVAYWTPQKECAERYMRYAASQAPNLENCIIQVAVPEELTKRLIQTQLLTDGSDGIWDIWREYIWHGRRSNSQLPETLEKIDQVDLIIGHIAAGANAKYISISDWRSIKKSDRMWIRNDGRLAVQWAFRSQAAEKAFEKSIYGKVYFHVYAVGM